jgi:hypothetical protein
MIHRRDAMLRLGQLGLAGVTLPSFLRAESAARRSFAPRVRTADHVIQVFLWGGPPQQDLWDLKPDAPEGIRSPFKPIETTVPGVRLCEHLPLLARQAHRFSLVRSLTHPSDVHEPSVYRMLTGRQDMQLTVPRNARTRSQPPNFGSVLSYFAEPGDLPASVTVPRPIGHDGVTYAGTHAGFLGPRHDPLERAAANKSNEPAAHALAPAPDLGETRLVARTGLLRQLERQDAALQAGRAGRDLDEFRDRALRMVASPATRRAFDLSEEPPAVRDRYGRDEYGESCLLARRLVEAGVPVVSVAWMFIMPNGGVANVWDNHGGTAGLGGITGYAMLRQRYCLPALDQALSAMLDDLHQRGLLERTLVVAVGEFGRTPRINKTEGRDHWGRCQTALQAGGGVRGGTVVGSSDAHAAYPKDRPVSPEDLLATVYHACGLPPETEIPDREGRPHRLVDGTPVVELFG